MSGLGDTFRLSSREAALKWRKGLLKTYRPSAQAVFQKSLARPLPTSLFSHADLEKCANRMKESPGYHKETFGNFETKEECRDKMVFKAQMWHTLWQMSFQVLERKAPLPWSFSSTK